MVPNHEKKWTLALTLGSSTSMYREDFRITVQFFRKKYREAMDLPRLSAISTKTMDIYTDIRTVVIALNSPSLRLRTTLEWRLPQTG